MRHRKRPGLALIVAAMMAVGIVTPAAAAPATPTVTALNPLPGDTDDAPVAIDNAGMIVGYSTRSPYQNDYQEHAIRWNSAGTAVALAVSPGDTYSRPTGLNQAGVAVGYSWASGTSAFHALRWNRDGTVTALPILSGDTYSKAVALNDRGTVIGYSWGASGLVHALRWNSDGTVVSLGTLPGDTYSQPSAINNSDTVVGRSSNGNGSYGNGQTKAVLWQADGSMTTLDTPADDNWSEATLINGDGTVAGYAQNTQGSSDVRALSWDSDGNETDLGYESSVQAIGSDDTVVGTVPNDTIINGQATSWASDGTVTPLPATASYDGRTYTYSVAVAINNADTIVGNIVSGIPDRGDSQAVRWNPDGTAADLAAYGGNNASAATAINSTGIVVGSAWYAPGGSDYPDGFQAVVWTP